MWRSAMSVSRKKRSKSLRRSKARGSRLRGQSRPIAEQDRDERSEAARVVKAGQVLRGCRPSLARELQEPILMDELTKIGTEFKATNVLQTLEVEQDVLRGRRARRRPQP